MSERSLSKLFAPRRSSQLFELPGNEKDIDGRLKKWEERWGHIGKDFVNVILYPEEIARALQRENGDWISCLKTTIAEADRNVDKFSSTQVVLCDLREDQNALLADIDSRINQHLQSDIELPRSMEIQASQNLTLDEDFDVKWADQLIASKLKK